MNQFTKAPISAFADIIEHAELIASLSFVDIYSTVIGEQRMFLVSDGSEVIQIPTI